MRREVVTQTRMKKHNWMMAGILGFATLSFVACGGGKDDVRTVEVEGPKFFSASVYQADVDALQAADIQLGDVGFHFVRITQPVKNPQGPSMQEQYMWEPNAVRASQAKSEDRQAALKNYMKIGGDFLKKYSGKVTILEEENVTIRDERVRGDFYHQMELRQAWVNKYWAELVKQGRYYGSDIKE